MVKIVHMVKTLYMINTLFISNLHLEGDDFIVLKVKYKKVKVKWKNDSIAKYLSFCE